MSSRRHRAACAPGTRKFNKLLRVAMGRLALHVVYLIRRIKIHVLT